MRFGLTANPNIPHARAAVEKVLAPLAGPHTVLLEDAIARELGRPGQSLESMAVDVILALGGDGTVLRALQKTRTKVLGVNSGSLGFLTEVTVDGFPEALRRLERGEFTVESRVKVQVTVDGKRMADCTNEAVVHTAHIGKIREFEIWSNGTLVERLRADGIIVASPTGSTSYNLSVGGPIVDPRVQALVVSAIAPFKPSSRPTVVPSTAALRVKVPRPKELVLVLDGQQEIPLKGTEELRFTGSKEPAQFVKFGDDFYRRIEEKLVGRR